MKKILWEFIPTGRVETPDVLDGGGAYRARIPGGWLVSISGGLAFVPDPDHAWDGSSLSPASRSRLEVHSR